MVCRLIGALLILGGCTGLGLWYREQMQERLKALRCLSSILDMLMSEIRYGKATLAESCKETATRIEEPYREALLEVYRLYDGGKGDSFGQLFFKQMQQIFDRLPLKKEDKACFLAPFAGQGFADGQMQLRCMEQSRLQLEERIAGQNRELKEKSQMAVGLGVMSGLLLVVIMI